MQVQENGTIKTTCGTANKLLIVRWSYFQDSVVWKIASFESDISGLNSDVAL